MPLDGSGNFNAASSSWNPAVAGTDIDATDWIALLADLTTALSTAVYKDGQSTPTANIKMGGFKLTGLAAGSAAGNSLRYEQLFNTSGVSILPVRSYLAGCTLSTAGSSGTMSIAAGVCSDSTNAQLMSLSAIAKTTASWSVGSATGGLDTGAIANTTWYHFYVITRTDTGVVDVLFSLSASAPTMPTNYTLKRRIGSGKTDGSAQWVKFVQNGDVFEWDVPLADLNVANPGTSAVSATLTVPTGIILQAWFTALLNNQTSSNNALLFSDLAITDTAPDLTKAFSLIGATAAAGAASSGDFYVNTNVSAQIRYRINASGASDIIRIGTKGWIDHRGRDA